MRLQTDAPNPETWSPSQVRTDRIGGLIHSDVIEPDFTTDAAAVNDRIRREFGDLKGTPPSLLEAMRYSMEAGGKRLRPILVLWACDAVGGNRANAWAAALAIECVHTFSLIHDDLPAIDNDDLRRGRPTSHVRFGEAMAILAGDALLAHAFTILSSASLKPAMTGALVAELAVATGPTGLIGGEVADIEGEKQAPDIDRVRSIHDAKTARLIQAACRMGAIAGEASPAVEDALSRFGRHLGLAFQATDDLLDVQGSGAELGKRTGKDALSGKQTYPRAVGLEAAQLIVHEAINQAIDELTPLGPAGGKLAQLARFVARRTS